jgi:glycosyltransferase involved in cell wall biosynthesis
MTSVDVWGFRSLAFQKDFEKHFGNNKPMFLCHSGIPEKYIESVERSFVNGVKHFVFVGSLYELKNVDITIRALHQAMDGREYTFDVVGDGAEMNNLRHLVDELEMSNRVVFHGRLKRDEAQNIVRTVDCFVMVSSREAFGLVYVEAMAKGCIIIGTKGQGIDGIVKHGENGFLCNARDVEDLAAVIKHIVDYSPSELHRISENAVATATNLTDRKVAEQYINSIINL